MRREVCDSRPQEAVYSVDFSAPNGILASGSKDKTVRLWQTTV